MWGRSRVLFVIISAFSALSVFGQKTVCEKASMIVLTAEKHHYNPVSLDDRFSELLFDQFLSKLDPHKLYLSEEDIESLQPYKKQLDDEIKNHDCKFVEKAISIYTKSFHSLISLLEVYINEDFNFNQNDTLVVGINSKHSPAKLLESKRRALIKYEILDQLPDSINVNSRWTDIESQLIDYQQKIVNSKIENLKDRFENVEEIADYVIKTFLNAIASTYDPHTNFFTVEEEQELENVLSKNIVSFGLELYRNENGEVAVAAIIPGSMAWNSSQINEGDIIIAVESEDGKTDLNNIPLKKVYRILNNEELTEATFYIKKKRTEIVKLKLEKQEIENTETAIESFVLDGDIKIGYIYLPIFYSNNFGSNVVSNGCANDIAKEIIKLKRQNIKGLIIDLRGNGGGSMLEAIRLSGSFINYGALGILDSRNQEPFVYKDLDRGVLYREPLAILVDESSASASEFFASAMQHYNRAVIVGSKTYGKSTAQVVMPVDAYRFENADSAMKATSEEGYLKLTESVFYDFDGTSYQNKGVIPDVALPSIYDKLPIGESHYPTSLIVGKIEKKTYAFPLDTIPFYKIQVASKKRVANHSNFQQILKEVDRTALLYQTLKIPVEIQSYLLYRDQMSYPENLIFSNSNSIFSVLSTAKLYNPEYIIDQYFDKEYVEDDIYIQETYNVLKDLITFE